MRDVMPFFGNPALDSYLNDTIKPREPRVISPENVINDRQFDYIPQHNEPDWDYDQPYQFCGKCGEELVDVGIQAGFNRRDGSRILAHFFQCKKNPYDAHHDRWEKVLRKELPF